MCCTALCIELVELSRTYAQKTQNKKKRKPPEDPIKRRILHFLCLLELKAPHFIFPLWTSQPLTFISVLFKGLHKNFFSSLFYVPLQDVLNKITETTQIKKILFVLRKQSFFSPFSFNFFTKMTKNTFSKQTKCNEVKSDKQFM